MLSKIKRIVAAALIFTTVFTQAAFAAQDISVYVNGNALNFTNQQPVIVDGRTLIPLKGVFENLGYNVSWQSDTGTVVLSNGSDIITIYDGSQTFTVNTETKTLDVPAQIINGSMMIPLRAVGECTGAYVIWNADEKSASVVSTLSDSEISEIEEYMETLDATFEKLLPSFLDEFNSAAFSGDYAAAGNAISKCKSAFIDIRSRLSSLTMPELCKNMHNATLEWIDSSIEFYDCLLDYYINDAYDEEKLKFWADVGMKRGSKVGVEIAKIDDLLEQIYQ